MTRSKFQAALAGVALVSALASTAFPGIAHAAQPQQHPRNTFVMSCYIKGGQDPSGGIIGGGVKLWSSQNQSGYCVRLIYVGGTDLTAYSYPGTSVEVYSSIASYDTPPSGQPGENASGYFSCTPGPNQIFGRNQTGTRANLSPGCVNSTFGITIKTY